MPEEKDIWISVKEDGINARGFGILAKCIMLDRSLSITAKAIYAYFCSMAGSGGNTFVGRSRIMSDLGLSKNTYTTHLHQLVQEGYIERKQENRGGKGSGFGKNTITIVMRPQKHRESIEAFVKEQNLKNEKSGSIKSFGWGVVPRSVMHDTRIGAKEKAFYAYLCAFAGNTQIAFPSTDKILLDLQISHNTYDKVRKNLVKLNYITPMQRKNNGKFEGNNFYLNEFPDEAAASSERLFVVQNTAPETQGEDKTPYPKNWDTQKEENGELPSPNFGYTQNWYPKNWDTNNNSNYNNNILNNNTLLINPSIYPKMDKIDSETADLKESILEQIGYAALAHDYEARGDRYKLNPLSVIADVLASVYLTDMKAMYIGGCLVSIGDIRERMKLLELTHIQYVLDCLEQTASEIRNPRAYLLTALYNAPLTMDLYYDAKVKADERSRSHA